MSCLMLALVFTACAGTGAGVGAASGVRAGRSLYLKNCAHCHADDATGDEGPDLHGLTRSDPWLATRIRNGIKGEMPAFGEKFHDREVKALIAYLHSLG